MQLMADPIMLMSYINTQLRDTYASLDDLVDGLDIEKEELVKKLADAGFTYNASSNSFR